MTIVNVGTTYIRVTWTRPKYSPLKIRVDYQYSLWCEEQPYFRNRAYLSFDYNEMNFTGLQPGSVCKITFAVFYNPSEFDRGVNYLFETLQSRKAFIYISIPNTKCMNFSCTALSNNATDYYAYE